MATKKTTKKAAPAAKKTTTVKKAKGPKAESKPAGPRHPKARVSELHSGKEALAKALAPSLATETEDADSIAGRLKTASNTQLLRLHKVVKAVEAKWGTRDKLIQAIADGSKKSKDKDYVAKLSTFSLPHLVDLARRAS